MKRVRKNHKHNVISMPDIISNVLAAYRDSVEGKQHAVLQPIIKMTARIVGDKWYSDIASVTVICEAARGREFVLPGLSGQQKICSPRHLPHTHIPELNDVLLYRKLQNKRSNEWYSILNVHQGPNLPRQQMALNRPRAGGRSSLDPFDRRLATANQYVIDFFKALTALERNKG
jgi:hypothetical protein